MFGNGVGGADASVKACRLGHATQIRGVCVCVCVRQRGTVPHRVHSRLARHGGHLPLATAASPPRAYNNCLCCGAAGSVSSGGPSSAATVLVWEVCLLAVFVDDVIRHLSTEALREE